MAFITKTQLLTVVTAVLCSKNPDFLADCSGSGTAMMMAEALQLQRVRNTEEPTAAEFFVLQAAESDESRKTRLNRLLVTLGNQTFASSNIAAFSRHLRTLLDQPEKLDILYETMEAKVRVCQAGSDDDKKIIDKVFTRLAMMHKNDNIWFGNRKHLQAIRDARKDLVDQQLAQLESELSYYNDELVLAGDDSHRADSVRRTLQAQLEKKLSLLQNNGASQSKMQPVEEALKEVREQVAAAEVVAVLENQIKDVENQLAQLESELPDYYKQLQVARRRDDSHSADSVRRTLLTMLEEKKRLLTLLKGEENEETLLVKKELEEVRG